MFAETKTSKRPSRVVIQRPPAPTESPVASYALGGPAQFLIIIVQFALLVILIERWQLENQLLTRVRSEEHTSELQSRFDLVCRRLLEQNNERPGRPLELRRS